MTARVLEYSEWSRLPEYMDPVLASLRPSQCRMCVVEHDGEIIARWLLYPVLMAEDLWVHPNYRVSAGRKLWRLMRRCAGELGFGRVVSSIVDPAVTPLAVHVDAETMPTMVTYSVSEVR